MVHITETLPEDWKYVSEGGASIVFSYSGLQNPELNGTVLRLRKSTMPVVPQSVGVEEQDDPDDPMIEYQKRCIERLIPREHLPRLESVRVTRSWLETLVALRDVERPADRRLRDNIDLTRTKAVLATDLVGGPWLAVEIKPKWAFLPSSTHLSEATRPIKTRTCRFCMYSHLKSKKGKAVSLGYCPLDLFSGDEGRVAKAIRNLWDTWRTSNGTINNLKIFINGKITSPVNASLILANDSNEPEDMADIREIFTAALLPLLMKTPVLRILSKLQRTLDVLDIEGLSNLRRLAETSTPLYRTTFASFFQQSSTSESSPDISTPPNSLIGVNSLSLPSQEPSIAEWSNFLDTYLSGESAQLNHSKPDPANLRYYLLAYLLSATFKDCSIIVRMEPLRRPGTPVAEPVKSGMVTVIDLDPKSMDRLHKWEKLDEKIVQGYSGLEERKLCVDGWVE